MLDNRPNNLHDTPADEGQTSAAAVTPAPRRRTDYRSEPIGEVVRMASKGDELAWAEMVTRFGPMVNRVAQRAGVSASEAADIQQLTWMKFMRHSDQLRDHDAIKGWLATTTRRESQRRSKNNSRQIPVSEPLDERSVSPDDVELAAFRYRFEASLELALRRLSPIEREILLRRSADPTPSYDEVAQAMGIPLGSIGPRRMRALEKLRRDPVLQRLARDYRLAGQPLTA